jgi:hypothetical protein
MSPVPMRKYQLMLFAGIKYENREKEGKKRKMLTKRRMKDKI